MVKFGLADEMQLIFVLKEAANQNANISYQASRVSFKFWIEQYYEANAYTEKAAGEAEYHIYIIVSTLQTVRITYCGIAILL